MINKSVINHWIEGLIFVYHLSSHSAALECFDQINESVPIGQEWSANEGQPWRDDNARKYGPDYAPKSGPLGSGRCVRQGRP